MWGQRKRDRLRALDEAQAYARCHGDRDDTVRIVKLPARRARFENVLSSGETIRTVAGPASDVSSLLRRQGGQVATASLQEDQRASGRATGDRMLVIMGDVPADSLRAFLLRVR